MGKHEVGDVVFIRNDLEVGVVYGHCRFVNGMAHLLGKRAVIFNHDGSGFYRIETEDAVNSFWWSDEMFEDDVEEPIETEDLGVLYDWVSEKDGDRV